MSIPQIDELLEAHIAGESPAIPDDIRAEFDQAVAGYDALQYALDETITNAGETPADRAPPELPKDYEIVRELGRGGMGVVYLVRQQSLGRLVAVKVLRPGEMMFGHMLQRFLDEARHLARLRHPNIVSVHEVGRAGDEPYFTMDYVDGEPLSALLNRERLSPTQALAIWKQAAEAVGHAHAQGIIHRDLKPGNVLVDALGRAYVTDFGLARDMTQTSQMTRAGEIMGTPAYMAPEQALGQIEQIGEATDVHALGVVLYEMLTGNVPYGNDAPARILARLLNEEPPLPRKHDKRIPRELETICLKAMARDPSQRYATVRAFQEDVCRFEEGTPVQARRPGPIQRSIRLVQKNWKAGSALVLTAAIVLALATFLTRPTVDDLTVAGDERHLAGRHGEAIELYRRALNRTWGFARVGALERIVRCSQEMGDRAGTIDAALEMLEWDPDAWFGEFNLPVAHAVLERRIAAPQQKMTANELTLRRFEISLRGPDVSNTERRAVEQSIIQLRQSLGKGGPESLAETLPGAAKSAGPPAALLKDAENTSLPLTQRTSAAYLAGEAFEQAGDKTAALSAYRRAFDLAKSAFPIYAGVTNGIESHRPRSLQPEPQGAKTLRHIAYTIRRIDPSGSEQMRGGLRFRIAGVDLSPDVGLKLSISLSNADGPDPGRGTQIVEGEAVPAPLGDAPVQLDQTAWVGVADGRYRLVVHSGARSSRASGQASRQFNMLHLDFGELPKEIEVRGKTVDLPPIRAVLVDLITIKGPAENAVIDPRRAVLEWEAFPLAETYKVTVWRTEMTPGGGTYFKDAYTVSTKTTNLPLADVPADEIERRGFNKDGAMGAWSVEAFDAQGHWIARSRAQRSFKVVDRERVLGTATK
jgi:predicted Ser/Thr protein kinase